MCQSYDCVKATTGKSYDWEKLRLGKATTGQSYDWGILTFKRDRKILFFYDIIIYFFIIIYKNKLLTGITFLAGQGFFSWGGAISSMPKMTE